MAIDQARRNARVVGIYDCFSVRGVAIFFFANRNDQAIVDHNGICRQNRLV